METLTLDLRTSKHPPLIKTSHRQLGILIWQRRVREHLESQAWGTSYEMVGKKNSKQNDDIQITDISEEIHFNIYLNFFDV